MPYIKAKKRTVLDPHIDTLADLINRPGELNYIISKLADKMIDKAGFDYAGLNAIAGVLHCAAVEFDRRIVAPYEDRKMWENGDVYRPEHIMPRLPHTPDDN